MRSFDFTAHPLFTPPLSGENNAQDDSYSKCLETMRSTIVNLYTLLMKPLIIMSGPAFIEVVAFVFIALVWIVGIVNVCRKKDLSVADKLTWIILILLLNVFALLAFMFWYPLCKRK